MGLLGPVMNNQAICLDRGVQKKQKYADEKNSVTTDVTVEDKGFRASSMARLGRYGAAWFWFSKHFCCSTKAGTGTVLSNERKKYVLLILKFEFHRQITFKSQISFFLQLFWKIKKLNNHSSFVYCTTDDWIDGCVGGWNLIKRVTDIIYME